MHSWPLSNGAKRLPCAPTAYTLRTDPWYPLDMSHTYVKTNIPNASARNHTLIIQSTGSHFTDSNVNNVSVEILLTNDRLW